MSAVARATPLAKRGSSARTFVLCPWTTVRGNSATAINLVQDRDSWLDLAGFNDATFVVEIANVTNPSGATPGYVLLYLESSPTPDESSFKTVAGPIVCTLTPATSPILAKTASAGAAALARFVRWRIAASGSASVFDVTMRIRAAANRSFYFAPTQLTGCMLWLRADLGASFTNQGVSGWADQSGQGNDASQSTTTNQPTFAQTAVNGFAAIQGNGNATTPLYMTTKAFTLGSAATIVVVVQPASSEVGYARLVEHKYNLTYYLGLNSAPNAYKLIVNNGTSPYGTIEGGSITAGANTIVTGMFAPSGATGIGALYINGSFAISASCNTPSSNTLPLYVMQDVTAPSQPWNGYMAEIVVYNRNLGTTEFAQLHRYLGARYGIGVP